MSSEPEAILTFADGDTAINIDGQEEWLERGRWGWVRRSTGGEATGASRRGWGAKDAACNGRGGAGADFAGAGGGECQSLWVKYQRSMTER